MYINIIAVSISMNQEQKFQTKKDINVNQISYIYKNSLISDNLNKFYLIWYRYSTIVGPSLDVLTI